jgi:hypothetical protein
MLKIYAIMLLFLFSNTLSAKEHNALKCAEIYKIVNKKTVSTNFSILTKGISQEDVKSQSLKGLLKSNIANQAAELELSLNEYALTLYNEQCLNK